MPRTGTSTFIFSVYNSQGPRKKTMQDTFWKLFSVLKEPYQSSLVRIVVEIVLFAAMIRYAFIRGVKKQGSSLVLSEKESEQLIREWDPKEMGIDPEENEEAPPRYLLSTFCPFLFNKEEGFLQRPEGGPLGTPLTTLPFTGSTPKTNTNTTNNNSNPSSNANPPIETEEERRRKKEVLQQTIDKYGVGTCGPRGFYGTLAVQLDLEKVLAKSLNVEEVVLYSHALLAVESVIRCFCKKRDVIFYDQRSSPGIRRGICAAKSKAISYSSIPDLNEKLSLEGRSKKFILTEGIFEETGETADILSIIKIKRMHKAFLILDESISIPLLGTRGCIGFFGADASDVDLRIGSLSNGYESAGGFCGSTYYNADQQRLSSLAYCFSASLPAVLTHYALLNLETLTRWETEKEAFLQVDSSFSSNSSYSSYSAESDNGIVPQEDLPRFTYNSKKTRNPLINSEATAAFLSAFNSVVKDSRVCVRAKNDVFTPIIRIVILEDHKEKGEAIRRAFALLKRKGIYTRMAESYEPALIIILNNSISPKAAEQIAKDLYAAAADSFSLD